jgi:hypothetical protein
MNVSSQLPPPATLPPRNETLVPIGYEAGWPQYRSGNGDEEKSFLSKNLTPSSSPKPVTTVTSIRAHLRSSRTKWWEMYSILGEEQQTTEDLRNLCSVPTVLTAIKSL